MTKENGKEQRRFSLEKIPRNGTVHNNLNEDVIIVLKETLQLEIQSLEKSVTAISTALGALSVFIGTLAVLLTAGFKNGFGFSAETWTRVFVGICVLALGSFIYGMIAFWKCRTSVDAIIGKLTRKEHRL